MNNHEIRDTITFYVAVLAMVALLVGIFWLVFGPLVLLAARTIGAAT